MMENAEHRRWPRRSIRIPVLLKCRDLSDDRQRWHAGETIDVSVDGMRVKVASLGVLPASSEIEVLYFQPKENYDLDGSDTEPIWMTGRLIWQDNGSNTAGLTLAP